jgi:hypothetical protein
MPTGIHKSIYIPHKIAEKLKERPDINISRVCRAAIEKACAVDESSDDSTALLAKLSDTETELRSLRSAVEAMARRMAKQADMVVLSDEEMKTYKEILDTGIDSFVFRTKKEAVEEFKKEQRKKRKKRKPKKAKSKARKLASKTEETQKVKELTSQVMVDPQPSCVGCGDSGDTVCDKCGASLCWSCWTGDSPDDGLTAVRLCPTCIASSS